MNRSTRHRMKLAFSIFALFYLVLCLLCMMVILLRIQDPACGAALVIPTSVGAWMVKRSAEWLT